MAILPGYLISRSFITSSSPFIPPMWWSEITMS